MTRPFIVGAAAAAIVIAAIVLTFFVDRAPDDPVRKPSSRWERGAPPPAMLARSSGPGLRAGTGSGG